MKLNDSFLGIQWDTTPILKEFFRKEHTGHRQMMQDPAMHNTTEMQRQFWLLGRMEAVADLVDSKGLKLYYVTDKAQQEAALIKYDIANMKWLRQIKDQRSMYLTSRKEFFRFNKKGDRITAIHYTRYGEGFGEMIQYDGFALDLKGEELKMLPTQDQSIGHRFIKLLMFIELSKIEAVKVSPGEKVKYGKGGDDKMLNDTFMKNVYLVNSNWNKIIIVKGGFSVSGHFRVQPCGAGRKDYKLIWIEQYEKGSYVRRSGREIRDEV